MCKSEYVEIRKSLKRNVKWIELKLNYHPINESIKKLMLTKHLDWLKTKQDKIRKHFPRIINVMYSKKDNLNLKRLSSVEVGMPGIESCIEHDSIACCVISFIPPGT